MRDQRLFMDRRYRGMTYPKISIVTPSFNQAKFLEQTICSVLDQNYPNLEYIVIDGGSTDGSVEIVKKYADRLAYWVSEKDGGHAHAINKGFSRSTGEIMAWINSDDMYVPWTLATVAEVFSSMPEVRWITGTSAMWNERGAMTRTREQLKNRFDFILDRGWCIQQESTFWRRSLWEDAGAALDETYPCLCDAGLWARFFAHTELCSVRGVLGGYRLHGVNRAQTQREQAHADAVRAAAKTESDLDARGKADLAAIRVLIALSGISCGAADAAARRLVPALYERAAYRQIVHDGEGWVLRRWPYDCKKAGS
jgi:hypothetical protein